jgi:hypothetical protein
MLLAVNHLLEKLQLLLLSLVDNWSHHNTLVYKTRHCCTQARLIRFLVKAGCPYASLILPLAVSLQAPLKFQVNTVQGLLDSVMVLGVVLV